MSQTQWAVVVAGGVVAGSGAMSRRLSTTVISGPMVFTAVGLAIGPVGLDIMDRAKHPEVTRHRRLPRLVRTAGASPHWCSA
jgi:hypothetical protein